MPRLDPCPRFGLLSALDVTDFDSQLFTRGGAPRSFPAGRGVFEDALMGLTGHGVPSGYEAYVQLASTLAALPDVWEVGIDTNDLVFFESDTHPFTVTAGGGFDELGFPVLAPVASVPVGAKHRATATANWTRGNVDVGPVAFVVTTGGGPVPFAVGALPRVQDVPVLLRASSGTADLDDVAGARDLTTVDTAAAFWLASWGVDDQGRAWTSYLVALADLVWVDLNFRDRLGFSGAEVPINDGTRKVLTAAHQMPGVLIPTRPLDDIHPEGETFAEHVVQTVGTYGSNYVATHHRWRCTAWLDGPADSVDLHRHWHYACKPYLYAGAPCGLYQDWGDSRRAGWRQVYGLLYTREAVGLLGSDQGGYRGRIRGFMGPSINAQETTWPNRLRMRSPLVFTVAENPIP